MHIAGGEGNLVIYLKLRRNNHDRVTSSIVMVEGFLPSDSHKPLTSFLIQVGYQMFLNYVA